MSASKSLWLHPFPRARRVRLATFKDYPYFFDFLRQYTDRLPEYATVTWRPFSDFTAYLIEAEDEDQAEQIETWIDEVRERIASGEPVPPLVRHARSGQPADGRHRAFAAEALGISLAPTIDID